jgi:hypothetical protein
MSANPAVPPSGLVERPPLHMHFSDPTYANELFTADVGQFTQYSIAANAGTFAVTGGQGVFTMSNTGVARDRFVLTGSAINNPIGWFQVDVVSVSGTPANWNIGAVGMAKDSSNGIWAEHDALNNQTRIDVRIGGVATIVLVSQTISAPYSLALSVYKNHLEVYTKSGSTWTLQLMYDIPSTTIDLTTADLSTWFPCLGATMSNNAICVWTYDNFKCLSGMVSPFEMLPSNLISVTEPFTSDTGQWTKITPNTQATFAIVSGQGKFSNPNNAARSDFFLEGADIGVPQCCMIITAVSQTNDGGTPNSFDDVQVGICKDVNNFIWARYDNFAKILKVRTGVAGVVVNHNLVSFTATFPFKLALTIVANRATIWTNTGTGWIAQTNYDFTSDINFKTTSMTGWKGAFAVETGNFSDWVVDDFYVGRFGTVGMRDQCLVTNEDGSPFTSGNLAYFTATCVESNGVGYMGVFSYNMLTRMIAQTGVIMVSRSGAVQNDLGGNLIKFNGGADCRLILATWGNGFGNTLAVEQGTATATDLLTGTHTVACTSLTLPGHTGAGGGEYDPSLVKIGSTWYLAYTITTDTSFAGNTFYTAVASSPDLVTWTQLGSPDSGNQGFEGTKIHKTRNGYFVYSGGHTTVRCYDMLTATFLGLLDVTTTGGTDTFPHASTFPNSKKQVMISFDNVKFQATNFTWGTLRVYEANRYK